MTLAGTDPCFDRVFTGGGDQFMQLAAGCRRGLCLAVGDVDTPATHPAGVAAQCQVHARFHATGVEGGVSLPGFELVERNDIRFMAAAATGDDTVRQCQRLAGDKLRIDLR